jgi:hypothetical protein
MTIGTSKKVARKRQQSSAAAFSPLPEHDLAILASPLICTFKVCTTNFTILHQAGLYSM